MLFLRLSAVALLAWMLWTVVLLVRVEQADKNMEQICSAGEDAALAATRVPGGDVSGKTAVASFVHCLRKDHDPDRCELSAMDLVSARSLDKEAASRAVRNTRKHLATASYCSRHY